MQKFDFKKLLRIYMPQNKLWCALLWPRHRLLPHKEKAVQMIVVAHISRIFKSLYTFSYTITMNKGKNIQGYFEYVIPLWNRCGGTMEI